MRWIDLAGVAAIRVYYVQEMLAILILLAVLFGCVAIVFLFLLMLNQSGRWLIDFFELRRKNALQQVFSWRASSEAQPRT